MESQLLEELATIRAEATRYESEKKSEADLYAAKKRADGDLLLKKSEAEGERLRNEAMLGMGGKIIAALEAVKNIEIGEMTVSTLDTDVLDIDKLLSKLGLDEED